MMIEDCNSHGIQLAARELKASEMRFCRNLGSDAADGRMNLYRFEDGVDPGFPVIDTNAEPLIGEEAETYLLDEHAIRGV
jgi:hypothetical protein